MKNLTKNLPDSAGVYLFKGVRGKVLYVGKAGNIRRRVSSYYRAPHSSKSGVGQKGDPTPSRLRGVGEPKVEKLLRLIKKIDYKKTDTAIEALILEAELIKKLKPPFNVREKDDKSFLYVEITDDEFPRVMLVRGKSDPAGKRYGPFTSADSIRKAMRIIRRIFPYNVHPPSKVERLKRPCFDNQIGLCPGTCVGVADKKTYKKTIKHIEMFLEGKKKKIINSLERDMAEASKKLDFEEAERLRRQIFALGHIQDIALVTDSKIQAPNDKSQTIRIEGYDISNISGTSSVGSMVVFADGKPKKSEYRKFRIRTIKQSDDVGMIKEILRRRFNNEWPHPDLILMDGGKGQVNAAKEILSEFGLKIPTVGIAKGSTRKKNEFFGKIPKGITKKLLIQVRDEAHRFAIKYHKEVRSREFIS